MQRKLQSAYNIKTGEPKTKRKSQKKQTKSNMLPLQEVRQTAEFSTEMIKARR